MEDADQRPLAANLTHLWSRLGDAVEQFEDVPLRTLVLIDRHPSSRIVADSDAAFALFQGLLVTGSPLESGETGGLAPAAAAARHRESG
jgi:hypothetical protein